MSVRRLTEPQPATGVCAIAECGEPRVPGCHVAVQVRRGVHVRAGLCVEHGLAARAAGLTYIDLVDAVGPDG